jgi:phage shock protein PspC (stress-responsive transcriptional regulator)
VAERLYRSRDDRMLAGVAGGVADMLDADPSLVRIIWALLAIFTGGLGFVVYIVMAIVVPEAPHGYHPMAPAAPTGPTGWNSPTGPYEPAAGEPGAMPQPDAGQATGDAPWTPPVGQPAPSYWTNEREARRAARRARRRDSGGSGRGGLIAGAVLIAIGGFFLIREFVPWFEWRLWWPVGLIGLGALLLVLALLPGRKSDN